MKKVVLTSFLMAFLCSVSLTSCNQNVGNSTEKLIIGLECNYAPFNWTENTKTESNYAILDTKTYAEGYDVQIAKIIAQQLDKELVIKKLEWGALIPSVQNGTIDLIIAGMSPTPSRMIDIDFTNPYYTSEHVLLVESNGAYANISDISELEGARIAGQIGTLYDDIAHAIPKVVIGGDKATVPEIISELQTGIIDGTVLELPVALGLVEANQNLRMIRFEQGHGFTKLVDEETNEIRDIVDSDKNVSIGLAKNQDDLKNSINQILDSITSDQRNKIMATAVEKQSA